MSQYSIGKDKEQGWCSCQFQYRLEQYKAVQWTHIRVSLEEIQPTIFTVSEPSAFRSANLLGYKWLLWCSKMNR